MASLDRIAFDQKSLWTMLGSFSVLTGVGVHSFFSPEFWLGFTFRSVGLVRVVGFFLAIVAGWYVVRTLWMFAHRSGAIEFREDSLVIRAAGPPVRRIAWLDVQSATASMHHVSIRQARGKAISVPQLVLGFPYGWGGDRLASEIEARRQIAAEAGEEPG